MVGRLTELGWRRAAQDLGFEIETKIELRLGGALIKVDGILVKNFGAPNGTIIVNDYAEWKPVSEEMIAGGYTCSVISEPRNIEEYDREIFVEILRDWMWTGDPGQYPAWL